MTPQILYILVASLRELARKKYNPYQTEMAYILPREQHHPVTPNITNVLDFLRNLYDQCHRVL